MHHRHAVPLARRAIATSALCAVSLFACSADDEAAGPNAPGPPNVTYRIEVTDATSNLTSNPSDDLFVVKLTAGNALVPQELGFAMQFTGGTQYVTRDVALSDTNKNGRLDVGESIAVSEGSTSIYGEGNAGQRCTVSLVRFAAGDPAEGRALATGTWLTR